MAPSSHSRWLSLTAIFLIFLSLFNIVAASPLPEEKSLVARAQKVITKSQYRTYCRTYFRYPSRYLLYSGNQQAQVEHFIRSNPGQHWEYYDTIFNAYTTAHPWYDMFNERDYLDDAEASSDVLAEELEGVARVFGAVEWQTKGRSSFFATNEVKILRKRMRTGEVTAIYHMAPFATDPDDVMAVEDRKGNIRFREPYLKTSTNGGDWPAACRRAFGDCSERSPLKRKNLQGKCRRQVGGTKGTKGTNGVAGANDACPLNPPKATATATKKPAAATSTAKPPTNPKTPTNTPPKTQPKTQPKTPTKTVPKKGTKKVA